MSNDDVLHNLIDYVHDCTINGDDYDMGELINETLAKLNQPHDDAQKLIDMLILCGEEECCDVKGYPQKLRALIDGLIKLRAENDRLRKEAKALLGEPIGHISGTYDVIFTEHGDIVANEGDAVYICQAMKAQEG